LEDYENYEYDEDYDNYYYNNYNKPKKLEIKLIILKKYDR